METLPADAVWIAGVRTAVVGAETASKHTDLCRFAE